jgi:PAS domain-containing protein
MQDEWQRLDEVVTVLTTATHWQMVCDTLQVILSPQATVFRLSHRGRKLTTGRAGEGFWISHEPRLRQAMLDQAPVHLAEGVWAGWWIPWSGGALHLSADLALPPRWLLTVAHLLSQFQRLPAAGTARGEDVKALRQLNELSWIIHGTPDLASLLRELPGHLGRHLGLSHCALLRLDDGHSLGMVVGGWELGISHPAWADLVFERHSPLGDVLWAAPAGRWQADTGSDEWRSARASALLAHGDALLAPLHAFGERWGLLLVRHPRPRSQRLGRLLAATADHVAIALSIRARSAAEADRRRQAEASFQAAPTPLALLDGEGGILAPNTAAQTLLGEALTPQAPFYQLLAAPDRQRVRDAWLDLESGRTVRIPAVGLLGPSSASTMRQVACNLAPLAADVPAIPTEDAAHGALARAVLSLCDHTSLVRQIRSHEAAVRLWESLAMALPVRIALVDASHHLVWANALPEGLSGTSCCCHPLFQEPDGGGCMALLALGQGITRRLAGGSLGSGGLPVQVWPVWDGERGILGAIAMTSLGATGGGGDAAAWAVVGQLLDGIRHDLHNPLGVISGRTEALRLDGVQSPHVDAIDRAVDRQVAMLRTLAAWKPTSGLVTASDVVEMAQETLTGLREVARSVALGWEVLATDVPLMTLAAPVHLQAFLTALFLLPGRAKGLRALRLICHGEPGWIHLRVEGADALPPLGPDGRDLLAALEGEAVAGGPTPTWRVPRWPY